MASPLTPPRRLAVIGGGISGLAAAWHALQRQPTPEVVLFEAETQLGGVLATEARDGYLIERSADQFLAELPWATELCRQVGLTDELVPTEARGRARSSCIAGGSSRSPRAFC